MKSRKEPSELTTNRFSFALPLALSLALMTGGTVHAEEAETIPLSRDEAVRMKLVFKPPAVPACATATACPRRSSTPPNTAPRPLPSTAGP